MLIHAELFAEFTSGREMSANWKTVSNGLWFLERTEDVILPEDLPETILESAEPQRVVVQYQERLKETKRNLIQHAR